MPGALYGPADANAAGGQEVGALGRGASARTTGSTPHMAASYLHDLARRKAEGAIGLEDMAGIDDPVALAALSLGADGSARGV